jgi:hypothetical protein
MNLRERKYRRVSFHYWGWTIRPFPRGLTVVRRYLYGNSGGGKGPQLKADARSDDGKGDWLLSLITPQLFSEVADSVTCNGYSDCVSLLREPDAANPHVRFDERGVEPEAWRS